MSSDEDNLIAMRHTLAHITASAVRSIWPEAKFGVGPTVDNGFYYDIDLGDTKISEDDFSRIEEKMKQIVSEDQQMERSDMPIDDAINWARDDNQPYKEELLNDLKRAGTTVAKDLDINELGLDTSEDSKVETVSFYKNGDFMDLCRGPHVESTGKVGAFKLLKVAGAYWRGKEENPQMQRLYGVAFKEQNELDEYLGNLEEAKKRDHRKLGQEMGLFTFSDLVGPGLPLWLPKGTYMRQALDEFVQELRSEYGYEPVAIPHITKKELYEKSGHWAKFSEELFRINSRDGHEFALKPMNCPHHTQIYSAQQRSYKELPIRFRETTMVYRDEQSGELGGLSRVRSLTQDDSHVFLRNDQIKEEVYKIWDMIDQFYSTLGMPLSLRLSVSDPSAEGLYGGSREVWEKAEEQLREVMSEKVGEDYEVGVGEAAFYGPKIDFMAKDALQREHQVATIQLDFNMPESFDLVCTNEQGERERIVMIHCAINGSLERSLAVLIEHYGGRFPLWLAPEQVRVITLNQDEELVDVAERIVGDANQMGIRVSMDISAESVGKKIRDAEVAKIPYTVVIGPKEVRNGVITPRIRSDMTVIAAHPELSVDEFLKTVKHEIKARITKTSL